MGRLDLQYLFSDQPLSPQPEGNEEPAVPECDALTVMSGGSRMFGAVLYPYGKFTKDRPCVIILHGFPGTTRNDDIAHALCRAGCVVLTPHHRGAWGSEGKYLITNCIDDAVALVEHVRSAEFVQRYKIDTDAVFLMGHSMGGCTAVNVLKRLPSGHVRGLILIAPYDPSVAISTPAEASTLDAMPDELRALFEDSRDDLTALIEEGAAVLNCDGADAMSKDARDNAGELSFQRSAAELSEVNVMCLAGMLDKVAPPHDMVIPLWSRLRASGAIHRLKEYPAGHSLQGFRCTATADIAEFILDCLEHPEGEQFELLEII